MVTRLGLYGGPRPPYGSFAGKVEAEEVAVLPQGGAHSSTPKLVVVPSQKKHNDDDEVLLLIRMAFNLE